MLLPRQIDTIQLSDDAKDRLSLYFGQFCEGENRSLYGFSHIIFACHAAFPMILSPELLNLIWLNFKTYRNSQGLQTIERVVVSDLLLSPLVRPVAHRQYEVIPEIRNYLLYLLKDERWFQLFGITGFGDKRLRELAHFLKQYLGDKRSQEENNAAGFMEVNNWASMAYLEPELLAYKMALAFKDTFTPSGQPNDDYGQLRLNMMIDRFGQQLDLDLHDKKEGDIKPFLNLRLYSKANKAKLFEEDPKEVANKFYELERTFISETKTDGSLVQLKLEKEVGERLDRKQKEKTFIQALLVGIDKYNTPKRGTGWGDNGAPIMEQCLASLKQKSYVDFEAQTLMNEEATLAALLENVAALFARANPEDTLLIYLNGLGDWNREHRSNGFFCYDTAEPSSTPDESSSANSDASIDNFLSAKMFFDAIKKQHLQKNNLVVFILDAAAGYDRWVPVEDIFILTKASIRPNVDLSLTSNLASKFKEIIDLYATNEITYSDLLALLIFTNNNDYGNLPERVAHAAIITKYPNYSKYALTAKTSPSSNYLLLFYNNSVREWQAAPKDFIHTIFNYTGKVSPYVTNEFFGVLGPIIDDQESNIFRYQDPASGLLHKDNLYNYKIDKERLKYFIFCKYPGYKVQKNDIAATLDQFVFDEFSIWDNCVKTNSSFNKKSDFLHSLFVNGSNRPGLVIELVPVNDKMNFKVSFHTAENVDPPSFTLTDLSSLSSLIPKIARSHYLRNLERQQEVYQPFDVTIRAKWGSYTNTNSPTQIQIDSTCFYIENGRVVFNYLSVSIFNKEMADICFDAYVLCSDLSIIPFTTNCNNFLKQENAMEVFITERPLLEKIFTDEGVPTIKVLMSYSPIQYDFSQSGI